MQGSHDIVAIAGSLPEGVLRVEGPDADVGVWVVPDDPLLPGLRSALHLPTVARLLSDLGALDEVQYSRLRAYRPGRRAVVEIGAGRYSIFLKVVPPTEVGVLHERHRALSGHLPVPDSIGLSPALGVVVMAALPGDDLRNVLRAGELPIPAPEEIAGMVEQLPAPDPGWRAISPLEATSGVVALLRRLVPQTSDRLDRLASALGEEEGHANWPVHGDFHEAQVLVGSGRPVGLIDVDTFGWGRRGDDAATMLGHLHLLADSCRRPERAIGLARDLNRHWDRVLDPVDLRRRVAAVILGLATGPFRVQSPQWPHETNQRIEVAEAWVESAERIDERSLISASAPSHVRFTG